jgi:hypothetical protein
MVNASLQDLVACKSISAPSTSEISSFNFRQNDNVWIWESGTIVGTIIDELGIITWNLGTNIESLCIIYKNSAGTVCYARPDPYSQCTVTLTTGIDNVWGYD